VNTGRCVGADRSMIDAQTGANIFEKFRPDGREGIARKTETLRG